MNTPRRRPGRPEFPLEPTSKEWPNRLREFRVKHHYSLKQIAEHLGVKPQTVSTAELYGRGLGRDNLYKLADLYHVDPRILEGRSIDKIGEINSPMG